MAFLTNLCVHQQGDTVGRAKTNRQTHFSWAAKFVIDLKGNIIKVADGSCTKRKKRALKNCT